MSDMEWLTGEKTIIVPLAGAVSEFASKDALLLVCDQNTQIWGDARNGIMTGSNASNIVSPSGKIREGQAVNGFAYKLAMERIYGPDLGAYVSKDFERGHALEPESRRAWEKKHDTHVEQVGFVYGNASKQYGCSPDGLFVHDKGLGVWETKSRERNAMCAIMAKEKEYKMPKDHYVNLQFNMWVCGANVGVYAEYYSSGVLPLMVEQLLDVDERLFSVFKEAVDSFCLKITDNEAGIRSRSVNSKLDII